MLKGKRDKHTIKNVPPRCPAALACRMRERSGGTEAGMELYATLHCDQLLLHLAGNH